MITIKSFQFNYFQENTFLLYDETGDAVLIDCGCCQKNEEKILKEYISQKNLTLKHLLCTHLHIDHIWGNPFIYQTYGLQPKANQKDVDVLPPPNVQSNILGLGIQVSNIPIKDYLTDNETIYFGQSKLKVITVPGHSPGSVAFYSEEDHFVIVGDALFARSIGRTDLWGGNTNELINAIRNKLLILPNDTIIYPGHGPKTTVLEEKSENPYL